MKNVYRSNSILSNVDLCYSLGLNIDSISKIERTDYYDTDLDNFKAYEFSFYEVTFR